MTLLDTEQSYVESLRTLMQVRGRGMGARAGDTRWPRHRLDGAHGGDKTPLGTSRGGTAGLSLPPEHPLDLNLEPWCWDGEGTGGSVGDSGTGGGSSMESSTAGVTSTPKSTP